jgi:hypothetical protein
MIRRPVLLDLQIAQNPPNKPMVFQVQVALLKELGFLDNKLDMQELCLEGIDNSQMGI